MWDSTVTLLQGRQVSSDNHHITSGVYNNPLQHCIIVPAQPHVTVGTTTTTSISLSWTSAGSEVDSYRVMWRSDECSDDVDEGSSTTITETSYILEGLREGTSYNVTVSTVGISLSDSVTGETEELGRCPM